MHLDAIDVEPAVVDTARRTVPSPANIRWLTGDVLTRELPVGTYDVVTAVASLHHLPLEQGLRRLADLVRPGGHVAVVGLARASSVRDHLPALATLPLDPVIGTWKALGRRDGLDVDEPPVPLRDPTTTVAEVTAGPGGSSRAPPYDGTCSTATRSSGRSRRLSDARSAPRRD